jgi:hypothetical protein
MFKKAKLPSYCEELSDGSAAAPLKALSARRGTQEQ